MSSSGVPAFSGSKLQPGTLEGNSELARAATALKERHLRFAHRVHAACRRHGARLGVEVARQKAEARMLREGLASVLQRRESLLRRLERAKAAHAGRARGSEPWRRRSDRSLGRRRRRRTRSACTSRRRGRRALLRAKLDGLKRRMDAVQAETGDSVDLKASASTGAGRGGRACREAGSSGRRGAGGARAGSGDRRNAARAERWRRGEFSSTRV